MFTALYNLIQDQLITNSFLSAGALLGIIGVTFAYLRRVPRHVWEWSKRRIITKVDIPDRDEAFEWLDTWLSQNKYKTRCRLWTVQTRRQRDQNESHTISESCSKKPAIILSPAPGVHFLFYKKRLLILNRERKDSLETNGGLSSTVGFRETFNFILFSRNKQIVLDLLEEARQTVYPETDARIILYRGEYSDWSVVGKRLPRSLESVILTGNVSSNILNDLQVFNQSSEWYKTKGIPYRRGYLLYGSPGNGKSSLVIALASELNYDICLLNLNSNTLSDERLAELFANVPSSSIILVEDIDCIFKQRIKIDGEDKITFSGLLNAIDGVMTSEGRILFVTTNHIELLDPALIRPGRIDMKIEISNATPEQAGQLFLRFFPRQTECAKRFASSKSERVSMATLQGHLLKYRNSTEDALTNPISEV